MGWVHRLLRIDDRIFHILNKMERHLSQLDTDVAALTDTVTVIGGAVAKAITDIQALQAELANGDTTADQAVVAAKAALDTLVTDLQAVALPDATPPS